MALLELNSQPALACDATGVDCMTGNTESHSTLAQPTLDRRPRSRDFAFSNQQLDAVIYSCMLSRGSVFWHLTKKKERKEKYSLNRNATSTERRTSNNLCAPNAWLHALIMQYS